MKLITLNTWGGRISQPFEDFLRIKQYEIDVFCFQEIYHEAKGKDLYYKEDPINFNLYTDIQKMLSKHTGFYHPHLEDWWGLSIFINKDFEILESGDIFIHKQRGYNIELEKQGYTAKNLQYIKVSDKNKKIFTILNLHGLWNGQGKSDTEERITQSKNIISFLKNISNEYILCGDFNLLPETESIKILEDFGLRNLIKEYKIKSTRTSYYKKDVYHADYIFTSKNVRINNFQVLPDEISDHAPLLLDFDI